MIHLLTKPHDNHVGTPQELTDNYGRGLVSYEYAYNDNMTAITNHKISDFI